jgi:tRNA pseudouridine(38-40) synthase
VNVKITIEYDGTNYHGWQIQPRGETIQAVLEKAVSTFLKTPTRVTGSGRTDAGVHALGQVANFFSAEIYNPHRIRRALNALTPDDIAIREVEITSSTAQRRRHFIGIVLGTCMSRWSLKRCAKLFNVSSGSMIFRPSKRQHATQSMQFERFTGRRWNFAVSCSFTRSKRRRFYATWCVISSEHSSKWGAACARLNRSRNYWKRATEPKPARRRLRMDCF